MDYKDYKTTEDRLPPKADWFATFIAVAIGLLLTWVLIQYVIGADTVINII